MLSSTSAASTEAPQLLLAGFGPFALAPNNPAGRAVERIRADGWSPRGASVSARVLPVSWTRGPEAAFAAVRETGCDAILLIGAATRSKEVRVEMRAQNRANRRRADVDGVLWDQERILATGPGVMRATAPVAEMVEAVKRTGLPVKASSESGDFVGNCTLYRLLVELGAGATVGCLSLPIAFPDEDADLAVKAATDAFARALSARRSRLVSA